MTAHLIVESGPAAGTKRDLTKQETLIGRHPECDLVVDDGNVSRFHAKIIAEGDGHVVVDLKSRNGTFLNGEPIGAPLYPDPKPHVLHDGDEIRLGGTALRYFRKKQAPFMASSEEGSTGSSFAFADDATGSTILSKLDLLTASGTSLAATAEAKLAALLEINRALANALSLETVLPKVLESLFRIFVQADRGFIVLLGPQGELIPRWMHTRRPKDTQSAKISRTIVREVLRTKEAILSADAASDDRFDMSQSLADFRIRSLMCAPLLNAEGEPLGVLQIDTLDQRKRFEPDDLEILAAVAAQAGIAIANAQYHEQLVRQRTLERDLQLANDVQRSFLPATPPAIPGYSFYNYYQAANQVGGDYFDYIPLSGNRLAIAVADVVGHGVAAALMMAKLSAETRYCLAAHSTLADAIAELNRRFYRPSPDRFITMVVGVLDPQRHQLTLVNAGHMAPLLRLPDGKVIDAGEEAASVPLGIIDDLTFEAAELEFPSQSCAVFYTDGISEAMNAEDECFGIDRIRQILQSSSGNAATLGEKIIQAVRQFVGNVPQGDDQCIVCVGRQ
jgi:serine phosphatase RsbU (regulator of sigma subunit)